MATYKNIESMVHFKDGGILYPVARPIIINGNRPDISVADTVKKYEIGTRWDFNGKTYRYGYAKAACSPNMGAKIYNHQDIRNVAIGAAGAAGDEYITCHPNSTDGLASDGIFAADCLKGGNVVVFPAAGATYTFTRGIIGNSARATDAGHLTIYLDAPLPYAVTTGGTIEAMASPWAQLCLSGDTVLGTGLTSCAGVATCIIGAGEWGWFQTKGPCWISPAATLGAGDNNRGAWLQGDASLTDQDASGAGVGQYAGWVMSNDVGNGQGAPFVMLQLE